MFTHEDVWRAIDLLARKHNLSTSGLARRAGLDATSFNKSKRVTPKGRPRWPSSESLAKVLACTNTPLEEFTALMRSGDDAIPSPAPLIPLISLDEAGKAGRLDERGRPSGRNWERMRCPGTESGGIYALRITDASLEPVYRRGDVIIVSPGHAVRPGDRVLIGNRDGELAVRLLVRMTEEEVELRMPGADDAGVERHRDLRWMARILWVSQ